jgi:hypothetical protein
MALPVIPGLEQPEHQQTHHLNGEDLQKGPAESFAHGAGARFSVPDVTGPHLRDAGARGPS